MSLPPRGAPSEAEGARDSDPSQAVERALRLGREAIDLFLATQPPGMTRAAARAILQRNKNRGRHPSRAADRSR